MSYVAPEWIEYQRRRFMRPDAQRYWRPDAERLVPRETLKALGWQDPYANKQAQDAAPDFKSETEMLEYRRELAKLRLDWELFKLSLKVRKALHPSDYQPRVPAGNSDGGQWTTEGATGAAIRLAGPKPSPRWHNKPPKDLRLGIPKTKPSTQEERKPILDLVARTGLVGALIASGFGWLREYEAELRSYNDPPRTEEELRQDVLKPTTPGYQDHHIRMQKPARDEGFPDDLIDSPENLVRIPTRKHREISAWFGRENARYRNDRGEKISPEEYLRGKDWDERRRVGIQALIEHRVLKP